MQEKIEKVKERLKTLKLSGAARFVYYILPIRKKLIFDNFDIVFGNKLSFKEKRRLAQCFYAHILLLAKEVIVSLFSSLKVKQERAKVIGEEYVISSLNEGKSVIVLSGHFGNFECAIAIFTTIKKCIGKWYAIRKKIHNKFVQNFVFKHFSSNGVKIIDAERGLHSAWTKLKNGNILFMLLDQHVGKSRNKTVNTTFFNKECGTNRTLAMLVQNTNTVVIPGRIYRDSHGRHVAEFFSPLEWITDHSSKKEEQRKNTQYYNTWMEKFVLDYPEQWWWWHHRWGKNKKKNKLRKKIFSFRTQ